MCKKKIAIVATGLLMAGIYAESPFKIMDNHFDGLNTQIKKSEVDFFPNYKIPTKDIKRGFTATVIDSSRSINSRSIDDRPFVKQKIQAFVCRGQYVMRNFAVNFLGDSDYFRLKVNRLRNKSGKTINADNVRLFRIVSKLQNKKYNGDFLIKPNLEKVKNKSVVYYAVLISAPVSTDAGLYKGELVMENDKGSLAMPVELRVLDNKLPEITNSFGMYMPGHFHDKVKGYRNWTPDFFTAENANKLFRFWKTRKLNSPTLFHVYPEWKTVVGKREPDFSTLSLFANAMKDSGLNGYFCIDTRFYAWYADAKAKQDINKARQIYSDIISKLLLTAGKEKWPEIKIFAEEEVGNGGKKLLTYRKYWPVLRKIARGQDYVLDNDIGYGRKNAVDRGARDGFKVRQYNSWTVKALNAAKKAGAEVWTYNYGGYNRGNFGFLQQRLNSKANHQWADMWQGRKGSGHWIFSLLTDNGVVSSMQYERVHEGINDFAYCCLLKQKIKKLEPIKSSEAEIAKSTLDNLVKNLPVTGPAFRNWMKYTPDSKLDLKRWQLVLAINSADKALGNKYNVFDKGAQGKTELYSIVAKKFSINNSKILYLPVANGKLKLDGMTHEKFWQGRNSTGALKITGRKEAQLRSYSSSDAEFNKLSVASYSATRVAYNEKGMLIGVVCNHVTPKASYISAKHDDDDGNMWRDDCMEFFMLPENAKSYFHLIVNSKGKKVLLRNGKIVPSKGIDIATCSPINKTGGYGQEIFIPWKLLGVNKIPSSGSLWKFNVAREFHAWRQYTSWGRVYASFHEVDKWGQIVFTGKRGNSLFDKIKMNSGLPGMNRISGTVNIPSNMLKSKMVLVLIGANGKVINRENIAKGKRTAAFKFDFAVPRLSHDQKWSLQLVDKAGKTIDVLGIPAYAAPQSVLINSCDEFVISGEMLRMRVTAGVSYSELRKNYLKGVATSLTAGTKYTLPSIKLKASGDSKLWLKTAGLKPDKYKINLWIDGHGALQSSLAKAFTVLPTPYIED